MNRNNTHRLWVFGMFAIFALSVSLCGCAREEAKAVPRTDILAIASIAQLHELARPAVFFMHDRHTAALTGQDCRTCHVTGDNGVLSLKFQRIKDEGQLMGHYHARCVECHRDRKSKGLSTGPVSCGGCHEREVRFVSAAYPMEFDMPLHYRHVKACQSCGDCHHSYDEHQKVSYVKGQESSCRDCHRDRAEENRGSMRAVSHRQCIDCHRKRLAAGDKSGPYTCEGCHDKTRQMAYERPSLVPRMERGQPIATILASLDQHEPARMNAVVFPHALHEGATFNCRSCHHETLQACRNCHGPSVPNEKSRVNTEQAMHDPVSPHSCVGCHNREQGKSRCAGCHSKGIGAMDKDTCLICHNGPHPGEAHPVVVNYADYIPQKGMSAFLPQDLPETVTIGMLSREYHPVAFPHAKVLASLRESEKTDRLASRFHRHPDTLCQGCHHHSPDGTRPPRCGSCHEKSPEEGAKGPRASTISLSLERLPGIKGAYHLQCMGCHQKMGLERLNACTSCHQPK